MNNGVLLGTTQFSSADQERFARLSGDHNPVHVDTLAARRMPYGQILVHGMHVVLRCLEQLAAQPNRFKQPSTLTARFLRPMFLDETIVILQRITDTAHHLECRISDLRVMTMTLSTARPAIPSSRIHTAEHVIPLPRALPCDLTYEELAGRKGQVVVPGSAVEFAALFPMLAAWVGTDTIQDLAGLSTLVGMECPGLHSVFGGFQVQWSSEPVHPPDSLSSQSGAHALIYTVDSTDDRFCLVHMQVQGAILAGIVDAIVRPLPMAQHTLQALRSSVTPGEFAGQVALILGGSRGLGELTAKLVAAGSGRSIITYAVGQADAMRVADEINRSHQSCDILAFDVTQPAAPQLTAMSVRPTHLYYFATPKIVVRPGNQFEPELFEKFYAYFCTGFADLCATLTETTPLTVFYPSTVFIDERPKGTTEYTMAKAAGEILCADLALWHKGLHILSRRLPRVPTDQTMTMASKELADAVAVMLPVVRAMHARRMPSVS